MLEVKKAKNTNVALHTSVTASAAPSQHSLVLQLSNTSTKLLLFSHSSTGTTPASSAAGLQSTALFGNISQYPEIEPIFPQV